MFQPCESFLISQISKMNHVVLHRFLHSTRRCMRFE
jgi:hypothetical protein